MTRINPDDPKWTAYVLGELDGQERAAVELELENAGVPVERVQSCEVRHEEEPRVDGDRVPPRIPIRECK